MNAFLVRMPLIPHAFMNSSSSISMLVNTIFLLHPFEIVRRVYAKRSRRESREPATYVASGCVYGLSRKSTLKGSPAYVREREIYTSFGMGYNLLLDLYGADRSRAWRL